MLKRIVLAFLRWLLDPREPAKPDPEDTYNPW
jgi:hypothetical protein